MADNWDEHEQHQFHVWINLDQFVLIAIHFWYIYKISIRFCLKLTEIIIVKIYIRHASVQIHQFRDKTVAPTIRGNPIALIIHAQATWDRTQHAPVEFVVRPRDIFQVINKSLNAIIYREDANYSLSYT